MKIHSCAGSHETLDENLNGSNTNDSKGIGVISKSKKQKAKPDDFAVKPFKCSKCSVSFAYKTHLKVTINRIILKINRKTNEK